MKDEGWIRLEEDGTHQSLHNKQDIFARSSCAFFINLNQPINQTFIYQIHYKTIDQLANCLFKFNAFLIFIDCLSG